MSEAENTYRLQKSDGTRYCMVTHLDCTDHADCRKCLIPLSNMVEGFANLIEPIASHFATIKEGET